MHKARLVSLLLLLLMGCAMVPAHGSVVFNWPSPPGWTAGAPSIGSTATQNFTAVNPNDITVSLYNQGVNIQGTYPQINSTNTTGGLAVNGLQLYNSSTPAFGGFIRTTVSFANPVTNLTFQLWDIDKLAGQFVDKIANLQAVAVGGAIVGADSVTSAVAGYNSITGTGLSTVILGTNGASNTTNQGTIDIAFNQPITQFSFEWSNNDAGRGAQAVGLGPLTFTVVPEFSSSLLVLALCAVAVVTEKKMRRRFRKTES